MNNQNLKDPFRQLDDSFFKELKSGKLKFILQFETKHRKSFMVEIRDNFLDIYFLGHSIEVRRRKNAYCLIASNTFNPKDILPNELKGIVKNYESESSKKEKAPTDWCISFDDIQTYDTFETIMIHTLSKIVEHRKGSISEGVSEINHFFDNRDIGRNGILIIDRQVVYPGTGYRIDLLGLRRINGNKFTFVVIELKNKNNKEIEQVFSQAKNYINILYDKYGHFRITYQKVLEQKIRLGLLKRISCEIAIPQEISKNDIWGVVILDNFNVRSDLKNITNGGLLTRAIEDWKKNKEYNLKLFLKTNVLDDTFFMDLNETNELLADYKDKNRATRCI